MFWIKSSGGAPPKEEVVVSCRVLYIPRPTWSFSSTNFLASKASRSSTKPIPDTHLSYPHSKWNFSNSSSRLRLILLARRALQLKAALVVAAAVSLLK
jgi:hypothetical protein